MIEMVSAFGPLGIASYAEATRSVTVRDVARRVGLEQDVTRHVALEPSMARSVAPDVADLLPGAAQGHLVHYMAERTAPTTNASAVGADKLHADYQVWCASRGLLPLSMGEFVEEFDRVRASPQLAGKIKKFGTRYFGIGFVDGRMATLPAR